ncbi:arabinofuranosyltransferase [Amycolatopsis sp. NPDC049868]|uniref:arabinofuranosyltransferase n=1 Tax=Amycolatopsis sp. NPDC049868 TaxID=3363934 RepID=UPI00379C043D
MSDDGLIVLRTVRQILAGNGPVFNIGERVEANTSTLWTAVLALVGWFPGVSLEWISVVVGLVFSAGGLFLALDGARRLAGPAATTFVFPAGALVVLALPPFRDFATSGLETGLISLWLGGTWWLLVRRGTEQPFGPVWSTAVVIGLGPLVRPDLALFSVVAMAGLLVLTWRGWRHIVLPLAAAAVLPVVYQVFRMGYYGLITPNTALVKEASEALWDSGWAYFGDFTDPYLLWIPVAACLLAGVALVWRKSVNRRVVVLVAVPLVGAILLAAYVVRVGGDFMHGRMLLPATFCLLLPVMVIRVTKLAFVPVVAVAVWAVVAGGWLRTPYAGLEEPIDEREVIADERAAYVAASGTEHPILASDFRLFAEMADDARKQLAAQQTPAVHVYAESTGWVAYPSANGRDVFTYFNIGGPGMLLPLDAWVHDPIGLANPVAAHSTTIPGRRIGHSKFAGSNWEVAGLADGTTEELAAQGQYKQDNLDAIRKTLTCPHNQEMLDSVRAPLTFERFWENLIHSVGRSGLRYDRNPAKAQNCG